jgi:hypothetical protein
VVTLHPLLKASPQKFYGRHTESVVSRVTTVKAKSKTHESRDKDEAMKTETNTTKSTYEIKENTHKTKKLV